MPDLILEKLGYYISHNVEEDSRFVVAAQPFANQGVLDLLPQHSHSILSFFHERNQASNIENFKADLEYVDLVLTDRMDFKETLQNHFPLQAEKIHYLSPFDTRLQLGKSQQRHESKIFYQIDLSELLNDYAIFKVLFYVAQHPDTELVIGVYNAWQEGIKQVENKVEELISDYLDLKDFIKKQGESENAGEKSKAVVKIIELCEYASTPMLERLIEILEQNKQMSLKGMKRMSELEFGLQIP